MWVTLRDFIQHWDSSFWAVFLYSVDLRFLCWWSLAPTHDCYLVLLKYCWGHSSFSANSYDSLAWCKSIHGVGVVTTNLAYHCLHHSSLEVKWGHWIWASYIPLHRTIVAWHDIIGCLLIKDLLYSQGVYVVSACPFLFGFVRISW